MDSTLSLVIDATRTCIRRGWRVRRSYSINVWICALDLCILENFGKNQREKNLWLPSHPQSYLVHIIIRKAGNAIMRKCIWPRIFSIFDCCSCLSLNPTKCWIKSLSTQVSYQPLALETEVNQSISKGGRAIMHWQVHSAIGQSDISAHGFRLGKSVKNSTSAFFTQKNSTKTRKSINIQIRDKTA